MTNLDSIFKSRDITLPTKGHLVKAMLYPVVMYGCESWTVKKAEHWRIDAFELWCWRRLLGVPWTARRSNQSILKISPWISLEGIALTYSFENLEPVCCSTSSSNCWFLICIQISQEAVQVVGILMSWRILHSLLWSTQSKAFRVVNEAEVDVFLEFSCFFYDPVDVGNLISGSSAFSKSSLYIWNFLVHILLKPSLKDLATCKASCLVTLCWPFVSPRKGFNRFFC